MITVRDIGNAALSALLGVILTGAVLDKWHTRSAQIEWERESIRAGFATYDSSSGNWRWKTLPELKESPAFKTLGAPPAAAPAQPVVPYIVPPTMEWHNNDAWIHH